MCIIHSSLFWSPVEGKPLYFDHVMCSITFQWQKVIIFLIFQVSQFVYISTITVFHYSTRIEYQEEGHGLDSFIY